MGITRGPNKTPMEEPPASFLTVQDLTLFREFQFSYFQKNKPQ